MKVTNILELKSDTDILSNPFDRPAHANAFFDVGTHDEGEATDLVSRHLNALTDFIGQGGYPSIGAQASVNSKQIRMGVFGIMADADTVSNLA
ncbi:hypothetical protein [Pricia sp.]|uniref:hypothetical protein n=1 Tax=Pricia sp. TaxID=2268138 RepID=UPI0035945BAD